MADIDEFSLSSSNIAGGAYDPDARVLTLTFLGGGTYHYSNVDPDTVEALKSAPSAGKFWNAQKNRFSYTRG